MTKIRKELKSIDTKGIRKEVLAEVREAHKFEVNSLNFSIQTLIKIISLSIFSLTAYLLETGKRLIVIVQ
jgi:hypothetical protein